MYSLSPTLSVIVPLAIFIIASTKPLKPFIKEPTPSPIALSTIVLHMLISFAFSVNAFMNFVKYVVMVFAALPSISSVILIVCCLPSSPVIVYVPLAAFMMASTKPPTAAITGCIDLPIYFTAIIVLKLISLKSFDNVVTNFEKDDVTTLAAFAKSSISSLANSGLPLSSYPTTYVEVAKSRITLMNLPHVSITGFIHLPTNSAKMTAVKLNLSKPLTSSSTKYLNSFVTTLAAFPKSSGDILSNIGLPLSS